MSEKKLKRNVKTHLFFNYYSIIFNVVINVILVPLYLHYISSELYGYWLAVGSVLGIVSMVDPGMADFIRQRSGKYYSEKKNEYLIPFLRTSLVFTIIFSLIFLFFGIFFKDIIFSFIRLNDVNYLKIINQCYLILIISS